MQTAEAHGHELGLGMRSTARLMLVLGPQSEAWAAASGERGTGRSARLEQKTDGRQARGGQAEEEKHWCAQKGANQDRGCFVSGLRCSLTLPSPRAAAAPQHSANSAGGLEAWMGLRAREGRAVGTSFAHA